MGREKIKVLNLHKSNEINCVATDSIEKDAVIITDESPSYEHFSHLLKHIFHSNKIKKRL
jgi:hypothetical protein